MRVSSSPLTAYVCTVCKGLSLPCEKEGTVSVQMLLVFAVIVVFVALFVLAWALAAANRRSEERDDFIDHDQ